MCFFFRSATALPRVAVSTALAVLTLTIALMLVS
jgi:hypothetical protein